MSEEGSPLAKTVAIVTIAGTVFTIGWAVFSYFDAKKDAASAGPHASASASAAATSMSASASVAVAMPSSPGTIIVGPEPSTSAKKQPPAGPSPVTTTKTASSSWSFTTHWSFELSDQDDSPPGFTDPAKHDALLFHGVRQPTKIDMSNQSYNLGIEAKWNQLDFPYYSDISSPSPTPDQCLNGGSDGTAQFAKGATPTYCRDLTAQNGGRRTVAFVKVTDSTNIDGSTPSVSIEVWFAYQG